MGLNLLTRKSYRRGFCVSGSEGNTSSLTPNVPELRMRLLLFPGLRSVFPRTRFCSSWMALKDQAMEMPTAETNPQFNCEQCGRSAPQGLAFAFKQRGTVAAAADNEVVKCIRCAFQHPPLVRRSLAVALVVGSLLTLLNQGDTLFAAEWHNDLYWKIPLTYCMPFCVATYGAISNARCSLRPG